MSVFSRRMDVVVVALSWTRTVAIEQGRWRSRRTAWKPAGGTTRNLRAVSGEELGIVFDLDLETPSGAGVLALGRETYRAKFSAAGSGEQDEDDYLAELDGPTWRTLTVGLRCRLT